MLSTGGRLTRCTYGSRLLATRQSSSLWADMQRISAVMRLLGTRTGCIVLNACSEDASSKVGNRSLHHRNGILGAMQTAVAAPEASLRVHGGLEFARHLPALNCIEVAQR